MKKARPRWGLALGGGGARGIAHVGILKSLERSGLIPDVITGTSIGALVGGAYACNPDAAFLEKRFFEVLAPDSEENKPLKLISRLNWAENGEPTMFNRLFRSLQKEIFVGIAMFRNGIWSTEDLRRSVAAFLPDIDLAETRIRFAPLTVDLVTGRTRLLESGPIIEAVMASCAVPGFMPPVGVEESLLMDGGLADLIPAGAARSCGAEAVIGVDVGLQLCRSCDIADGIDAINRATDIMSHHLGHAGRSQSDLLIEPLDAPLDWTDFEGYKNLVQKGESAAESAMDEIRALLQVKEKSGGRKSVFSFFSGKKRRPEAPTA